MKPPSLIFDEHTTSSSLVSPLSMLLTVSVVCAGALLQPSARVSAPALAASVRPRDCSPSMLILGGEDGDIQPKEFVDPLAKPRPKYDLAAASGRPDETAYGAAAAASPAELAEWSAHMQAAGLKRALGLFSPAEAGSRSPDGTVEGYTTALEAQGFTTAAVVDASAPGARDAVLGALNAAKAAREKLCIHCTDGLGLTGVTMADWLLVDYIGGDNVMEAADAIRMRKRLTGVPRSPDVALIEAYRETGSAVLPSNLIY